MTLTHFRAIARVDHARIHVAYRDNKPSSLDTEWLLFNARSLILAEAKGNAVYLLYLAKARQKYIRGINLKA